jgi:uncharacterized protein (TIGR02118 family)
LPIEGLKGIAVDQGICGREPDSSPDYAAMGHMYFDSVDAYRNAFGPHAEKLRSDIPNFTNVWPTLQISEVKLSNDPEVN